MRRVWCCERCEDRWVVVSVKVVGGECVSDWLFGLVGGSVVGRRAADEWVDG